jgi:hypothetical protein
MTRLEMVIALSVIVLFCGCGGGAPGPAPKSSAPAAPAPQASPRLGNWQFTTASTVPGKPPVTFAGSLSQAGAAVNGALHVDGSNCFDRSTTIPFTSTVSASSTSLTSSVVDGQVVTLTGNFDQFTFNGTYGIKGGCAAGEQGSLTGVNISNISKNLSGTFINSAQKTFSVAGEIAQSDNGSSDGSFPISGTATFDTPCLSTGAIQPGTFPNGSFILGMSVALQVQTSKGILTFLGTLNPSGSGEVSGNYTVSGGGCDDSGTAVLQAAGEWDY